MLDGEFYFVVSVPFCSFLTEPGDKEEVYELILYIFLSFAEQGKTTG